MKINPEVPHPRPRPALVIFDCDGVLVDSELIASHVLADALSEAGYKCPPADCLGRFLGRDMTMVVDMVEAETGRRLAKDFLDSVQERTFAAFRRALKPVPGVHAALAGLDQQICVASSGKPEKIALSLALTGLDRFFDGRVFSASMVARAKPAPDLFLHAAAAMAVAPDCCLVIEDSPAGIEAARAAGMRVLGFAGASHGGPDHAAGLRALGAETFADMSLLPALVERI